MSKKVRTLLRVSSKQQLHDDDIPIQRAEARQYLERHPDWVFDREYIEKAVSAYRNKVEDREVLKQILQDAKEHQFDILLAYMSDRIGRQEEYSFYVAALNQIGIEVWTIRDGQLKTGEHVDKLLNYIRFWQNEGESKKIGMRVRDTQRELIKAGKFVGGKAPYGYRLVSSGMISNHGRLLKKLEVVEENAEVVRKIYSLAVHQGMGYERITKELNRQGILAAAGRWKAGTIRNILTNPIYMGYLAIGRRASHGSSVRTNRQEWIYSNEPIRELEIISPKIWEKAQQIREARKARIDAAGKEADKEGKAQPPVPFSTRGKLALIGISYCGYCGKRLKNGSYCNHWTTKAGEKKTAFAGRYICPERCAERSCYSQSYLEGIVFEEVEGCLSRLKPIDVSEELQKRKAKRGEGLIKEIKAIEKEQKTTEQDIKTLEDKIPQAIRGEYYFSEERLTAVITEKEEKCAGLEQRLAAAQNRLRQIRLQDDPVEKWRTPPDWKEEFRRADPAAKKMLLAALIDRIEVKNEEIAISFRILLETPGKGVPE